MITYQGQLIRVKLLTQLITNRTEQEEIPIFTATMEGFMCQQDHANKLIWELSAQGEVIEHTFLRLMPRICIIMLMDLEEIPILRIFKY